MSDNELDRTLVPQEQSFDSVPYSTPPLMPLTGVGHDSSISTIVSPQSRHRLDRSNGAETAVVPVTAETVGAPSFGAFVQPHPTPQHRLQLFRYPNAFARHHHPPATINKHEPKRACTSLPLYLSKCRPQPSAVVFRKTVTRLVYPGLASFQLQKLLIALIEEDNVLSNVPEQRTGPLAALSIVKGMKMLCEATTLCKLVVYCREGKRSGCGQLMYKLDKIPAVERHPIGVRYDDMTQNDRAQYEAHRKQTSGVVCSTAAGFSVMMV
uniref:Uncharacterized protein n=1 Tax=Anopheles culicifacies TaxID=139723 RepID=A0A182MU64_9DIPT